MVVELLWSGLVCYDMGYHGMVWYSTVQHSIVWFGLVSGMARYGQIWYGT